MKRLIGITAIVLIVAAAMAGVRITDGGGGGGGEGVPYTGATDDLDLGANDFTVDSNTFYVNSLTNTVNIVGDCPSATCPPLVVQQLTPYGAPTYTQYIAAFLNSSGNRAFTFVENGQLIASSVKLSGQIVTGNGVAQFPAFADAGNDAGMYFPTDTSLSLTTSDQDRLVIDSAGGITIGGTLSIGSTASGIAGTGSDDFVVLGQLEEVTDIFSAVSNVSATAVITSNAPIYKVTTATAVTISNDLSNLVFSGNEAKWELWVDLTATNALDSVFASNTDWVGGEPELTVTGKYKYACSSIDGITVTIKQTYPTVHKWQSCPVANPSTSAEYRSTGSSSYIHPRFTVGGSSGVTWTIVERACACPSLFSIPTGRYAFTNGTPVEVYSSKYYNAGTLEATFNTLGNDFKTVAITTIPRQDGFSNNAFLTVVYRGDVQANLLISVLTRPMNELEIKAYADGWRP